MSGRFVAACSPTGSCGIAWRGPVGDGEGEMPLAVYHGMAGLGVSAGEYPEIRQRAWNPDTAYSTADVRAGTPGMNFLGGEITPAEVVEILRHELREDRPYALSQRQREGFARLLAWIEAAP